MFFFFSKRAHLGLSVKASSGADDHEYINTSAEIWLMTKNGGKDPCPLFIDLNSHSTKRGGDGKTASGSTSYRSSATLSSRKSFRLLCGKTTMPLSLIAIELKGAKVLSVSQDNFDDIACKYEATVNGLTSLHHYLPFCSLFFGRLVKEISIICLCITTRVLS